MNALTGFDTDLISRAMRAWCRTESTTRGESYLYDDGSEWRVEFGFNPFTVYVTTPHDSVCFNQVSSVVYAVSLIAATCPEVLCRSCDSPLAMSCCASCVECCAEGVAQ